MNGEIAQLVALTCFGNATLEGMAAPLFFPKNSTFQFCEFVKFKNDSGVFDTPEAWFKSLKDNRTIGIVLGYVPSVDSQVPDRELAGFVGGGGTWYIETMLDSGTSLFWHAIWQVGNQGAHDRKIWRVTYEIYGKDKTRARNFRTLTDVHQDFEKALVDIHQFSKSQFGDEGFTKCFADGLIALKSSENGTGYFKDLFPPKSLSETATTLLNAANSAWVFGGMGSWNDMGFEDATQAEYDKVSQALFVILNEAITLAATSSWSASGL